MPETASPARKVCGDSECTVEGPQLLPAFPLCRARPDGRGLYCKACCVRRVRRYRAKRKAVLAAQYAAKPKPAPAQKPPPVAPVSRYPLSNEVRQAIEQGHATFAAICLRTGERQRNVSDALAHLLLTARSIRMVTRRDGVRLYFLASVPTSPRKAQRPEVEPALSFSTLHDLMPRQRWTRRREVKHG